MLMFEGVAAAEPGEEKENIDGGRGGGTDENEDGDIKKETEKNTDKKTDKRLLFKKKVFIAPFFLNRLRFRSLLPRLQGAVLPAKVIKFKKKLFF